MKPMYSQGKLVRFTKACPECTATSLCHSCRLKKTHEPCNQSPLVEDCDATFKIFKTGQTQIHGANICKYGFKKTRCTLRVSIRRMWKPRVAARQLFQLVLPPSGDSKTISDSQVTAEVSLHCHLHNGFRVVLIVLIADFREIPSQSSCLSMLRHFMFLVFSRRGFLVDSGRILQSQRKSYQPNSSL